jgi:hypothetical protein
MVDSLCLILILQHHDNGKDNNNNNDVNDDKLTALVGTSTLLLGMILRSCVQDDIVACGLAMPNVGAALEIFPLENQKKNLGFHVSKKNRNKKNEQAKPTEQLRTTPKLLIFNVDDGDQNARRGQYYAMLPLCSP